MTSSWWAVPALSGAMALAGVLVGQVVVTANERWKAKREDLHRWHAERLKLYLEFTDAFETFRNELSDFLKYGPKQVDLGFEHGRPMYDMTNRTRLISTTLVHDAAVGAWAAAFCCLGDVLKEFSAHVESLDAEDREAFVASLEDEPEEALAFLREVVSAHSDALSKASVIFNDAVRAELGVPGRTAPREWKQRKRPALKRILPRSARGV
ncbi:hypothetical protein [Micromonospora sp. NPDC049801]|uniref:hypothetical protein n=1 Tax=unclassified Micromonospora TaxID=2617518 RepID=UPI0033D607E7